MGLILLWKFSTQTYQKYNNENLQFSKVFLHAVMNSMNTWNFQILGKYLGRFEIEIFNSKKKHTIVYFFCEKMRLLSKVGVSSLKHMTSWHIMALLSFWWITFFCHHWPLFWTVEINHSGDYNFAPNILGGLSCTALWSIHTHYHTVGQNI